MRGLYVPGAGHAARRSSNSTAVRTAGFTTRWKTNTQLLRQDQQTKLIAARRIAADESLLNLRDIDSGKTVRPTAGRSTGTSIAIAGS